MKLPQNNTFSCIRFKFASFASILCAAWTKEIKWH